MSESKPGFKLSWKSWLALLAVIGVIFVVGIASYGDYTHRAQASEAVALMGGAKTQLAEYFENQKRWPIKIDEKESSTSGKHTLSVAITKGAGGTGEIELTATMKTEGVDRRVRGQSVRMLSADGGKSWVCKPGTMEPKNLPVSCRN